MTTTILRLRITQVRIKLWSPILASRCHQLPQINRIEQSGKRRGTTVDSSESGGSCDESWMNGAVELPDGDVEYVDHVEVEGVLQPVIHVRRRTDKETGEHIYSC
jgi:hypothetical protein